MSSRMSAIVRLASRRKPRLSLAKLVDLPGHLERLTFVAGVLANLSEYLRVALFDDGLALLDGPRVFGSTRADGLQLEHRRYVRHEHRPLVARVLVAEVRAASIGRVDGGLVARR